MMAIGPEGLIHCPRLICAIPRSDTARRALDDVGDGAGAPAVRLGLRCLAWSRPLGLAGGWGLGSRRVHSRPRRGPLGSGAKDAGGQSGGGYRSRWLMRRLARVPAAARSSSSAAEHKLRNSACASSRPGLGLRVSVMMRRPRYDAQAAALGQWAKPRTPFRRRPRREGNRGCCEYGSRTRARARPFAGVACPGALRGAAGHRHARRFAGR